jgi:hypothetical protein
MSAVDKCCYRYYACAGVLSSRGSGEQIGLLGLLFKHPGPCGHAMRRMHPLRRSITECVMMRLHALVCTQDLPAIIHVTEEAKTRTCSRCFQMVCMRRGFALAWYQIGSNRGHSTDWAFEHAPCPPGCREMRSSQRSA